MGRRWPVATMPVCNTPKNRYGPTLTSDVWVRPKRDKSVKSSPHCRTTEGQPVDRVGTGNDVQLGCLRGEAARAQCDSLNTRLRGWMARGFQAVMDVRHGCGVTEASVDSRDCQVGAVNDNQRVALDVQLQRRTGRDGVFDQAAKSGHHKGPAMGRAIDHALARTERAHVACRPHPRQLPRICHAPDRLKHGLCRTWRESIANEYPQPWLTADWVSDVTTTPTSWATLSGNAAGGMRGCYK